MRMFLGVAALVVILAAVSGCGDEGGGGPAASIRVTSPDGGEEWVGTYGATVTWESSGYAGNVDIEYSTDDGATWVVLAADTEDDGSETVSAPNVDAPGALVQVSAADGDPAAATAPFDESGAAFTILPAFKELDQPAPGLAGVYNCSLAWGDADSDGDLDLAVAGWDGTGPITKVYENDGAGVFTDITAGLTGVASCSLAWGDADSDGDLDLAVAGWAPSAPSGVITKVYANDGVGGFTEMASLTGVELCSLAWGDCDNDGDLDLAVAGRDAALAAITKVYENEGAGVFTDLTGTSLTGVYDCSLAWGDCDNDGDLDLAVAGLSTSGRITKVYENEGAGVFTDITAGLTGVDHCSLAWGDCDNDGDLDLAVAGYNLTDGRITKVYENEGAGAFAEMASLTGVHYCSLAWGDYDNDGDLDLAVAGHDGATRITKVYENEGAGVFTDITAGLTRVEYCSLAWGDCDNDGDLDLAVAGRDAALAAITKVYENNCPVANAPPDAPAGPVAFPGATDTLLVWEEAFDAETPPEGLSYNLRVRDIPNATEVVSAMADPDGRRHVPALGPVRWGPSYPFWSLALPSGVYFFEVQAIDSALEGGAWSEPELFTVP